MKNEQQSQNLLLKVDPRSTFRNNFLQPATSVFVAGQVDHVRPPRSQGLFPGLGEGPGNEVACKVKNGKHRRKIATKQCCATS